MRGAADSAPPKATTSPSSTPSALRCSKTMQRRNGKIPRRHRRLRPQQGQCDVLQPRRLRWRLTKGTRVMLSGEVGYFRGAMQLTHPDFLVLGRRRRGRTQLRQQVAAQHRRRLAGGQRAGATSRTSSAAATRSIRPATKLQSWDIFACVRQVLEVLDPVPDPLPAAVRTERGLIGEDEALRAIHLAENAAERAAPGSGWPSTKRSACSGRWRCAGTVNCPSPGPPAPRRDERAGRRTAAAAAVRADRRTARGARRARRRTGRHPSDESAAAG